MQILVTSPIPSHPQNHGNRSRVFKLCLALKELGHTLHYVYSGFEGLTHPQEIAMRKCWDHVHIIPPVQHDMQQKIKAGMHIDAWYQSALDGVVTDIMDVWSIDAVLCNYVWASRYLDTIPAHIPKYIDTHDKFSDRHAKLAADGIAPTWFSTTKKMERTGFARADAIFAIQDIEAEIFRGYSPVPVHVVGHLLQEQFLQKKPVTETGKLQAGFMASDNVINRRTIADFSAALDKVPAIFDQWDIHLAGAICGCDEADNPHFIKHGFVANQIDFYKEIDLVLNPNMGGSGLKIKSIEALAFGRPLIATSDAMIGIASDHPMHAITDMAAFCAALQAIAADSAVLDGLCDSGRQAFRSYHNDQIATLSEFFPPASIQASTSAAPQQMQQTGADRG